MSWDLNLGPPLNYWVCCFEVAWIWLDLNKSCQLNMRHICRKWGLWKIVQNILNALILWFRDFIWKLFEVWQCVECCVAWFSHDRKNDETMNELKSWWQVQPFLEKLSYAACTKIMARAEEWRSVGRLRKTIFISTYVFKSRHFCLY